MSTHDGQSNGADPVPEDGRAARGRRTREAVVEAVIALLGEGDVRPTAARVAERAGVSLRSVFQHFTDLEDLFATVADRQFALLDGLPPEPAADQPLDRRIAAFAEFRAALLERLTPVRRAAMLQEPFSAVVRERLDAVRRANRRELERVFAAELEELPEEARGDLLAALRLFASWSAWETLRREQGLSVVAARRVLEQMVAALLCNACSETLLPARDASHNGARGEMEGQDG